LELPKASDGKATKICVSVCYAAINSREGAKLEARLLANTTSGQIHTSFKKYKLADIGQE
jgi:hypothetical protein